VSESLNLYKNELSLKSVTKICLLGDTGTASSNQKAVAKALESEGCTQVRLLGDIVYKNGISSSSDPKIKSHFLSPYSGLLNSKVDFYLLMGNHDYRSNPSAWLDVAKKYEFVHFPSLWYVENYGGLCIFTFDTNASLSEQSDWFLSTFDKLNCKKKIALGHHPYLSVGFHGDATGRLKRFIEFTLLSKVDAYIAGHDHNLSYNGSVKSTQIFVSGAGAKTRIMWGRVGPGQWAKKQLGYLVFIPQAQSSGEILIKYYFKGVKGTQVTKLYEGEF